ncbi:MAG: beta-ketoacyl synthase N-terminal-like domain-containing protein [Bacteroidetes bacterium]|nr:beta-ketoacyl synthase N-terminal-like domain-containing protein [Bacteroidota bacterium]
MEKEMGIVVSESIMTPVYVASDNIVNSMGLSTDEVIHCMESDSTGFRRYDDRSLTPSPLPLSLVNSELLETTFRSILAARHPEIIPGHFTRMEKMFIVSIHDALSKFPADTCGPETLLVISTTKGNIDLLEENKKDFIDPGRIYLWKMADFIGSFFGFANRPLVISNACISGVLALTMAERMIDTGRYKHIVVAGGDILSEFVISGFLSFQALSPQPCRPFDLSRDGLSLGEGCGTVILTSDPGIAAPIMISGSATSNDANHISGPSRTGEELAMAIGEAMKEAVTGAGDISFISAHGTATIYNDEMESKALGIAGLQEVPVNSFKGYWGHTLGAAGVIESIATIRSMKNNRLYRSAGFSEPGVPVPLNVIRKNADASVQNCLKIASGFGGCNAAIVFRKS